MTGRLCVDTSAWHHSTKPHVQAAWRDALDALHHAPTSATSFARALEVQAALAHVGGLHHRSVKIADLLIAASAEASGDAVWHYDEDFDRIASITGQPCEWIAPRGSF